MSDRKARLAALATRAGRSEIGDGESEMVPLPQKEMIQFRNYSPNDTALEKKEMDSEMNSKSEACRGLDSTSKRRRTNGMDTNNVVATSKGKSKLERALLEAKVDAVIAERKANSKSTSMIGSKKANWDLKRDISKKLERLERRTQKEIVGLLRERLEREASEEVEHDEEGVDLD